MKFPSRTTCATVINVSVRPSFPLLKPPRLRFGDVVGLVAPGSPPRDARAVTRAITAIAKLGFKPRPARNVRQRLGFLAGDDTARSADLMEMFSDREVRAIFCLRGGYGAGRLLTHLDYALIRREPKIFVGYSDITALHCAFLTQARLVSFHGPMMIDGLGGSRVANFALPSLLRAIMEPKPAGSICEVIDRKSIRVLKRGRAEGRLIGGNLSLLCATLGTPFQPDFRDAILFFEDIGEEPYRLDRMLTHLLNAGLLQTVAGVAVGINAGCQVEKPKKPGREYRQSMLDVLEERLGLLNVPVVVGLPFGHVPRNATLPVGLEATLDAKQGDLIVNEAAVQ
jgi:muramoyltetrapeptide carboxypeptidase